jgi:hypothetical protein
MMTKETTFHRLIILFIELVIISNIVTIKIFLIDRLIDDSPSAPVMFFGNIPMFMNDRGGLQFGMNPPQ